MKAAGVILCWLILLVAMTASSPAWAVWVEDEVTANVITVTASSEFGSPQAARHLVDGAGMQGGVHDNNGSAQTMWHTTQRPAPSSAAAGLPESPAWVRFDFAQPQKFDSIHIWNHNQANLTDRGFRRTRMFGSPDGTAWFALTSPEVSELPRARGSQGLEAVVIANAAKTRAVKSVVIAAETKDGNYGGDYFGLSAVRFGVGHEVAEADLPLPTSMACAALPYSPYRANGEPGREIAVSLRGVKLYGEVTFEVECAGVKERTTVPANKGGAEHFSVFLPSGISVTNECEAIVELHSGRAVLKQTVAVPACKPRVYYVLMHSHCDIGYTDIPTSRRSKPRMSSMRWN
jgi:hypothetical protein